MEANNHISKSEHKLLLIVAFMTFVFAFSNFTSQTIQNYNDSVSKQQEELKEKANKANDEISFGLYILGRADLRPFYNLSLIFLSLFIFLALKKSKIFLLSSLFTVCSFLIFFAWFVDYNHAINSNETKPPTVLERLLIIASIFDYIVFVCVSILLFWQISILLRMLIKTLQRKTELP